MNFAADLNDWIVRQATDSSDIEALVAGVSERLVAGGLPLTRLQIGMPSIDPKHRGISVTWKRGGRTERESNEHGADETFRKSPIQTLIASGLKVGRWNVGAAEGASDYPLMAKLHADGCTDYVLKLVSFPEEAYLIGMACSIATDAANGFSGDDIARLDAVLPALGLAAYRLAVTRAAAEALRVYVGPRTGERILAGQIRRGEGQAIYAAILFADMKNFTSLNERYPAEKIVALLNENFEALGAPIDLHGGEILKFMGDSLLAIFPVDNSLGAVASACTRALAAAEDGLAATRGLNRGRATGEDPEIPVDIVLHLGEVFYGNVGAARRLDFTVIGPAVNEASRLEALCDRLGRNLVMSKVFADHCEAPTQRLGTFELKGVKKPHTVFGIAEATRQV